ncbi:M23 family metallopeptidase [Candidatus Latescibacterota bacterium]
MGWKNLTFILIPHSQSTVKQLRVNRLILMSAGVVLIIATAVMIFYIWGFQSKSFLLSSSREIEKQNAILEMVVTELDSSIAALTGKIDSLKIMAEKTRLEADISGRDLQLMSETDYLLAGNSQIPLKQLLSNIDRLERRSYVLAYNFNTLYEQCTENTEYLKRVPSIRPASGFISKDFNWLERTDEISLTEKSLPGVSITNVEETPIIATADGVVSRVETTDELGRYIEIDHENGYRTRYTHLQSIPQMEEKIRLNPGDKVTRGQVIATMGRTGISIQGIAPHIMYTVEYNGTYVDPNDYFFCSDTATPLPLGILLEQHE